MRVAVVGAGGILGRAICRAFISRGARVTGFTKNSVIEDISFTHQIVSGESDTLKHVSSNGPWDCVVDLRAFTTNDLCGIEEAFSGAGHWIHISTMYVYRSFSNHPEDESQSSLPLDEERVCSPHGIYGAGKYECEQLLRDFALQVPRLSILRLPFVIGLGDRSLRVSKYIELIQNSRRISLPFGGRKKVEIVFASDAAERIADLASLSTTTPLVTNIVGAPCLSLAAHLEIVARVLGCSLELEDIGGTIGSVRHPFAFPFSVELCRRRFDSIFGQQATCSIWEQAWEASILSEMEMGQKKF